MPKVRSSFVASARTYGARRVWRDVLADGLHKIERRMRAEALRARPRRRSLSKDGGERLVSPVSKVLDRQFTAERPNQKWITDFPPQTLMSDNGVTCSMSRSGNVRDNAAMESFFSSMKTERVRRQVYRSRDAARADVFDYIERF